MRAAIILGILGLVAPAICIANEGTSNELIEKLSSHLYGKKGVYGPYTFYYGISGHSDDNLSDRHLYLNIQRRRTPSTGFIYRTFIEMKISDIGKVEGVFQSRRHKNPHAVVLTCRQAKGPGYEGCIDLFHFFGPHNYYVGIPQGDATEKEIEALRSARFNAVTDEGVYQKFVISNAAFDLSVLSLSEDYRYFQGRNRINVSRVFGWLRELNRD